MMQAEVASLLLQEEEVAGMKVDSQAEERGYNLAGEQQQQMLKK
jgi:hypothetical protein